MRLKKRLETFEFVFVLVLLSVVHGDINIASQYLQNKEAELLAATEHLKMALDTLTEYRQDFEKAKGEAVSVCNKWDVNASFKEKRSFK